jgi:LCP family protein required for cell wall assembly
MWGESQQTEITTGSKLSGTPLPQHMGAWADIRRSTRILWRVGLAFGGLWAGMWLADRVIPRQTISLSEQRPAISRLAEPPGQPQTVLLLGLDQPSLHSPAEGDVQLLLLLRVHPSGGMELLQIPSELEVLLPGQNQLMSLQELYQLGGVALTSDVVSQLLGGAGDPLRPDRYALIPMGSLREAIDAAGGIPFLLQTPLRYQDKAGGLNINLQAGQQWLTGEQTLQLLRLRGTGSEGARRQRQQELLLPIAERLGDPAVVPLLPELLEELNNSSDTNLSKGEILSLLAAGLQQPNNMRITRLPLQLEGNSPRLDQPQAERVLERWFSQGPPSDSDTAVAVMGTNPFSSGQAVNKLQQAGQPAFEAELPLEAPIPRTLIRYSVGRAEALAVRLALGQGELQPGPTSPDTGIVVLLGQDWRP